MRDNKALPFVLKQYIYYTYDKSIDTSRAFYVIILSNVKKIINAHHSRNKKFVPCVVHRRLQTIDYSRSLPRATFWAVLVG
jgi:uncharacterized protein YbcV (DUF1398 family)